MKKLLARVKNWAKRAWLKCKQLCKKAGDMIVETAEWMTKHPESIYILGTGISLATAGIKKFGKSKTEREQAYQRTHVYDCNLGHHWTLRRELTSSEMLEYNKRKNNGETIGDILESMKVLA